MATMVSVDFPRPMVSPCQPPSRGRPDKGTCPRYGTARRAPADSGRSSIPRSREGRVGKHLILAVEAQQPRHENHPLVHLPAFLDPIDGAQQRVEKHRHQSSIPERRQPCAAAQILTYQALAERAERDFGGSIEEGCLDGDRHA